MVEESKISDPLLSIQHADEEAPEVKRTPHEDSKPKILSNITILIVTTILFTCFVVAEIIGAFASNSLSLLGDAFAMSVDAFTYACNLYAEITKRRLGKLDDSTRFALEVVIPSFSVVALIGVTIYITYSAVEVLLTGGEGDDVNNIYMFAFASGNFAIDVISSVLFYIRGKDVLLHNHYNHPDHALRTFSLDRSSIDWKKRPALLITTKSNDEPPKKTRFNLNMVSALTHVGGDTLRTLSVFFSAMISTIGHFNSSICDSCAAIIISVTILFAIFPLCKEIYHAATTPPHEY